MAALMTHGSPAGESLACPLAMVCSSGSQVLVFDGLTETRLGVIFVLEDSRVQVVWPLSSG